MVDVKKITGHSPHLETKTFRIQALTPVFVGSGNKLLKGVDIIDENGATVQLDLNKVYHQFVESDPDGLSKAIERGSLKSFLNDHNQDIASFTSRNFNGKCLAAELMDYVRDGLGNPILPGSSLKGSLKTALFHKLFSENPKIQKNYKSYLVNKNNKPKPQKFASQDLQNALFSTNKPDKKGSAPNYDIGRVIRTADVPLTPDDLEVINTSVLNISNNGAVWKTLGRSSGNNTDSIEKATKVSTLAVKLDQQIEQFKISLDYSALQAIGWKSKFDWNTLQDSANALSRKLIENELEFFGELGTSQEADTLEQDYNNILEFLDEDVPAANEEGYLCWIQRLGWGSGWLSMTGMHMDDDQMEEVRNLFKLNPRAEIFPKTRKIVLDNHNKPHSTMGWILVEEV